MKCKSCFKEFPDYKSLAIHISSEKKGYYKGKRWAAKFLLINGLSAKAKGDMPHRTALTEEEKESRDEHRELSGEMEYVNTKCPRCKRVSPRTVEVEYVQSETAMRDDNGTLLITCQFCGARQ